MLRSWQATDGLTDNLPSLGEAHTLVPALLSCTVLDRPLPGSGLGGTAVPGWREVMTAIGRAVTGGHGGESAGGGELEEYLPPELRVSWAELPSQPLRDVVSWPQRHSRQLASLFQPCPTTQGRVAVSW